MDLLFLSPFSITVGNVLVLLSLLVFYLWRIPEKSPATRSLIVFLSGVWGVFLSFLGIFSSLDATLSTRGWWLLHLFVFPAVAMVQFAYFFPENRWPKEEVWARWFCFLPALFLYPAYLWHTLRLTPSFSFEGFLFVYLDTPEVGTWIGLEILWMLWVFFRKARRFEAETQGQSVGLGAVAFPKDPRARLIRNMMLIFFSPLVLVGSIVLAYLGTVSWGLVGQLMGSGVIVAAFLFAVLYINNSKEPSTFMLKLLGISLGAILIAFGLGAQVAIGVTEEAYDRENSIRIEQFLKQPGSLDGEGPAFVLFWPKGASEPQVLEGRGDAPGELGSLSPPDPSSLRSRSYRQLAGLDPRGFVVTYSIPQEKGISEFGFSYLRYRQAIHRTCLRLFGILVGTVALVLLVFPFFFRLTLLRPLLALLEGVDQVNEGSLEAHVEIQVQDEIGYLSRSFNQMVGSIRSAQGELERSLDYQIQLTDAYSCFFPREFLEFLEKSSVTEIRLGDNVQLEMSVLFSDIRSFTNLSEKMSPEETFAFVNAYLGRVGPVVREQGGFIDKFIGDAVMALFPVSVDQALSAAIGMQQSLRSYNLELEEQGEAPIETGIGIHTGPLMLGTIGESRRMEGTVISDAVNLASRVEGLTKRYGAAILITDASFQGIQNPQDFSIRLVDRVKVKGKQKPVSIFEVLDGLSLEIREKRLATREGLEEARSLFAQGELSKARLHFGELQEADPEDRVFELYLDRIDRFRAQGLPEGFDGVIALDSK